MEGGQQPRDGHQREGSEAETDKRGLEKGR